MMTNAHRKNIWIAPLLALVVAGCTESTEADRSRVVIKQAAQAPVVKQADSGGTKIVTETVLTPAAQKFAKVIAVDMTVDKNSTVTLKNVKVYYGEPPNQIGNPPMFTAQVLDAAGNTIYTAPLWDPRWTFVWRDEKDRDFVDLGDRGTAVVIVPFKPGSTSIRIIKNKERAATVELSQAFADFCAKNREDPDCRGRQPTRRK